MPTPEELTERFWEAVKADWTMMVGVPDVEGGHMRPMTAVTEGDAGPIWFFTSRQTDLAGDALGGRAAVATMVDKGHGIFACVHGRLMPEPDREMIDRLWNPFIAAWYEGKDDPDIALLRFEPGEAEIWENGSSLMAGIRMLFGSDPKEDYDDKVAKVRL